MVVYEDGPPEPVRVFDRGVVYKDPETFGEYQLSYRSGDILSPRIAATEPLVTELGEFVRLIRTEETCGNLELARQVVMLAEAAECSLANGGAPVGLSTYSAPLGLTAAWPWCPPAQPLRVSYRRPPRPPGRSSILATFSSSP